MKNYWLNQKEIKKENQDIAYFKSKLFNGLNMNKNYYNLKLLEDAMYIYTLRRQ